jgi:hypothetical protein
MLNAKSARPLKRGVETKPQWGEGWSTGFDTPEGLQFLNVQNKIGG